ncbi:hypothetical protein B0H67DRAFT_373037 [Lasiosphaeris hirsuta]|uniref:Uncharacterized protein n=1 Tax=Lasiosphaeris hirsuta TaxID=260670 RepID=A0AA39ZX21_9PEZI|nr:hypothetical protein B0H67DRAFT_373037 [Lasiosphaeris hirsuta]
MKFLPLVFLSLTTSALARGGGGGGSTKSQCKALGRLTSLAALVSNETALAEASHNNATRAEALKAKASTAATMLTTLQANVTLVSACAEIAAVSAMEDACEQMSRFAKLEALAANATALGAKTDGNATKAEALKAKAAAGAAELADLRGNATIAAFCADQKTKDDCKHLAKLTKEVALAANATAVQAKFDGDADRIAKFQQRAAKTQGKLAALQGNATLMAICAESKGEYRPAGVFVVTVRLKLLC